MHIETKLTLNPSKCWRFKLRPPLDFGAKMPLALGSQQIHLEVNRNAENALPPHVVADHL